jgi:hypothetical protein
MPRTAARFEIVPAELDDPDISCISTAAEYDQARRTIGADTDRSIWLRVQIPALEKRPPLDALEDAFTLYRLARARCEVLGV